MSKVKDFISRNGARFTALLGMLGSGHSGEAANAASLATKMLSENGLTWGEVAGTIGSSDGGNYGSLLRDLRRQLDIASAQIIKFEMKAKNFEGTARRLKIENERLLAEIYGLRAQNRDYSKGEEPVKGSADRNGRVKSFNILLNELIDSIEGRLELKTREEEFLSSIRKRHFLSAKQNLWLRDIAARAGVPVEDME